MDPNLCEPQLAYETTLNGTPCFAMVEQPCAGDSGATMGCAACAPFDDGGTIGSGSCSTSSMSNGSYVTYCGGCCPVGRAPRGFAPRGACVTSSTAATHAVQAQLEAASVDAFLALHADLARAGAPRRLLAAVRAAARDEVRHARAVGRAARRFGAQVPPVEVKPIPPRSLERLAIENAEEGCIEEAFGAAIATIQAKRACDAGLRRLMQTIAREELEHAALAWDIARWLEERLDARARRRVRRARRAALLKIEQALASGGVHRDDALGIPDSATLHTLLRRMWSPLVTGELC